MRNVHDLAESLGLLDVIARAVSFHQGKLHLGLVWNIPVEFDNRLQTTAGKYFNKPSPHIKLNPVLRQEALRVDLAETFLHELAHAHAYIVYGRDIGRGHGAAWWEMMYQLGQIPCRCHNIAACAKATKKSARTLDEMGL